MKGQRDSERRAHLLRLWNAGTSLKDIAAEYGGTPNGVRSTIRKMRERGEAPGRNRAAGKCFTFVAVDFYATHDDPKKIKPTHGHQWFVRAWFPAGSDGRDLMPQVESIRDELHNTHIPGLWGEGVAATFGQRLAKCVAVDVWREDQPFGARWEV